MRGRPTTLRALLAAILISAVPATCPAQGPNESSAPSSKDYVSREEYEKLKADQQALREELEALKRERAAASQPAPRTVPVVATPSPDAATAAPRPESTGGGDPGLLREVRSLRQEVDDLARFRFGSDHLVIAGDASIGFTSAKHSNSTFSAGISPLFLWRPTEKLLVEAAVDINLNTDNNNNSSTSVDLTIANASYEVNDFLILGGGLFIVPFGVYHNHFDPPWINKFPDDPLAFSDGGVAPNQEVGVFARGAMPAGPTKITYDLYVTNGPNLITNDPNAAGQLNFHDFTDLNGNKAVGGRVGFLPRPDLELGYSFQFSEPNPSGTPRVHALLQALDINFRPVIEQLHGVLDVRAEYVWSHVGAATFDPTGSLGFGPTRFRNDRSGGYVQVAYRPTLVSNRIVRNIELVGRFDWLTTPLSAPGGEHERRWTIGADYWLAPNVVLKVAYEFDHKKAGTDTDAFLVQMGLGL